MPRTILKKTKSAHLLQQESAPKSVCWGDLHILEFPNILGDNPAAHEGAPLTIGWKPISTNVVAVEYYEYLRQSHPRRSRKELSMSGASRDTYLLGLGYKLTQLIDAAEETKKIRRSRHSNMKGTWDKFKAVFDVASNRHSKKKPSPKIVVAKSG